MKLLQLTVSVATAVSAVSAVQLAPPTFDLASFDSDPGDYYDGMDASATDDAMIQQLQSTLLSRKQNPGSTVSWC